MRTFITILLTCCCTLLSAQDISYKFDFTKGKRAKEGYIRVESDMLYTPERGYGYDFVDGDVVPDKSAAAPFYFSVDVPDGNYRVNIVVGNTERLIHAFT